MENSKKPWLSKTVWFAFITAAASFYPPAADFVKENLEAVGLLWGALAFVLRLISKEKIVLLP